MINRVTMNHVYERFKHEDIIGAEVGVQNGINAKNILSNLPIKKLYLIDAYTEYPEYGKEKYEAIGLTCAQDSYDIAKVALHPWEDKIKWLIGFSDKMHTSIPDESLHFCYIDINHHGDSFRNDLYNYYPKVRKGGILGGHDFCNCSQGPHSICENLQKFTRDINKYFICKSNNDNYSNIDWWIVKWDS